MATPSTTSTMDGYIRVSRVAGREGPSYISPDVQRDAISKWAEYRGVVIDQWHVDEDQSGGTMDRPGLKLAMERIESGQTGGLVCWKLNRFARTVRGALETVKAIHDAGAQLVCVEEDIDTTGPFGAFMLTILLAVATLERDSVSAGWAEAKARALDRGAPIGPTPYGYARDDAGRFTPHPDEAPIVARAYELAATRGPDAALAYLREQAPEKAWSKFTLRRLLAARSYLGEVHYGDTVMRGVHPPLVEVGIWKAAQVPQGRRRRSADAYPLSGVAQCATCGEGMVGARAGKGVRTYRCRASLAMFKGARCPTPAMVNAEPLEAIVRAQLDTVLAGLQASVSGPEVELEELQRAVDDAEGELIAFAADTELRRSLGDAAYGALRDVRVAELDAARAAYEDAARDVATSSIDVGELADDLGALARAVLSSVTVLPGRGDVPGRVAVHALHTD